MDYDAIIIDSRAGTVRTKVLPQHMKALRAYYAVRPRIETGIYPADSRQDKIKYYGVTMITPYDAIIIGSRARFGINSSLRA